MANLNELKPVQTVQDIINKFCYTIGMLPSSYKTSLTYEEQVMAIGRYLEETVIPALNNNAEAVLELQNLYVELKNYVDNYFDNLDVQEEINNKLDEMAEDGELQEILKPYFNSLTQQIENLSNEVNGFEGNLDLLENNTNSSIENLQSQINSLVIESGSEETSIAELIQARINLDNLSFDTLNDRINYIEKTLPFKMQTIQNADFNSLLNPGKYIITSISNNRPIDVNNSNIGSSGILIVEAFNSSPTKDNTTFQWIVQKWYPLNFTASAYRIIQRLNNTSPYNYNFNKWNILNSFYFNKLYAGLKRESLTSDYNTVSIISSNDTDFNTLTNTGNYIVTSTQNPNNPLFTSGFLEVQSFYNDGDTYKWVIQTFQDITLSRLVKRIFRKAMNNTQDIYEDWQIIYNKNLQGGFGLDNKIIVNFGDSIFR